MSAIENGARSLSMLRRFAQDPDLFGYNFEHGRDDAGATIPIYGIPMDASNAFGSDPDKDTFTPSLQESDADHQKLLQGFTDAEAGMSDSQVAAKALGMLAQRRGFKLSRTTNPEDEYAELAQGLKTVNRGEGRY